MKLITRCPQCHTSFRVHDHQLAVRQGRVRCGACGHVFDAYSTLTEQPDEERGAQPGEWQRVPGAAATDSVLRTARADSALADAYRDPVSLADPIFDVGSERGPRTAPEARLTYQPRERPDDPAPATHSPASVDDLALAPSTGPEAPQRDATTPAAPAAEASSYSIADPLPIAPAPSEPRLAPPPELDAPDDDFQFGPRRVSRRARIGMSVAAGLLAVLALGQLAFATRSYIAAWAPGARTVFEQLCAQLGCEVPPLRRAEAVLLDSSELEREEAGLLTLSAVIRNTSIFEQALPSLMLTLLDDRNRAIARRIVDAKDYLPDPSASNPVLPASGVVQATVYIDASKLGQAAANYELFVFYR